MARCAASAACAEPRRAAAADLRANAGRGTKREAARRASCAWNPTGIGAAGVAPSSLCPRSARRMKIGTGEASDHPGTLDRCVAQCGRWTGLQLRPLAKKPQRE